jgi:AcrR family transcriptional regulator
VASPRQASRDAVLDVAVRVFSERGYGETSLRQLIGETGMSPTAFYARYRSKEAVLEALVGRMLGQLLSLTSTTFAGARSVDEGFEASARGLVAALAPQKPVVRLAITEAAALPALRRTLHGAYGAIARLVASYLTKLGRANAQTAGWTMLGAVYIQVMRWALFDELDDAQFADELLVTARLLRATVAK